MYNYSIISIVRYCFLSYHCSKYMETKSARQIRSTCVRAREFHPTRGGSPEPTEPPPQLRLWFNVWSRKWQVLQTETCLIWNEYAGPCRGQLCQLVAHYWAESCLTLSSEQTTTRQWVYFYSFYKLIIVFVWTYAGKTHTNYVFDTRCKFLEACSG